MPGLALLVAGLLAAGCAVAGPSTIRNGRPVYNDAITATNNEQLLAMIVRMRYEEPAGLLAVASVTANVRIQGTAGTQIGVGPDSDFEGNLVPLSAGVLYEENPTISYTPVQGEMFLRQMLAPLPLDLTALLLSALGDSPRTAVLLIRDINGLRNPNFLADPTEKPDARFDRVAEILAALHRRGSLIWAQEPGDPPSFAILLRGEGAAYADQVGELHSLLGLSAPRNLDEPIIVQVFLGAGKGESDVIELRTRSVYDLFRIAAASVEVPPDHLESGLAPAIPPVGPAGAEIRIRRSASRPSGAMVAVRHHGWWYSIDGTDGRSKQTFRLMDALLADRIAESVEKQAGTPVLTVPAAR